MVLLELGDPTLEILHLGLQHIFITGNYSLAALGLMRDQTVFAHGVLVGVGAPLG